MIKNGGKLLIKKGFEYGLTRVPFKVARQIIYDEVKDHITPNIDISIKDWKVKFKVSFGDNESNKYSYKEINIHGKLNTELDEVDLFDKIIYEDKSAVRLYMDNPDYPQTEAQWALKQIFKKGSNRIDALQQTNFRVSSQVSGEMPSIEELRSIRKFVFRIDKNTPQLREAVTYQLERLESKYPEFDFLATYGGVE